MRGALPSCKIAARHPHRRGVVEMAKKKAPPSSEAKPKGKSAIEPATKADVRMLSVRLDSMQRELEELWKRTAPDTELD